MEPAAPGTEEDDVTPILSAELSKKIDNEEDRLLSLKFRFASGKWKNVFELKFRNGTSYWYCNVCTCSITGRVYNHEIGKRHSNTMQKGNYLQQKEPEEESTLQIAPGQPIPPGVEEAIEKAAEIQERLDNYKISSLVGLEYLLELQEIDQDSEPSYLCILCDIKGDARTVITHISSYSHINQYLQQHFITVYRMLLPTAKHHRRNWKITIQKIATAIEIKYGRLKPHVVDKTTFLKSRCFYHHMVSSGPHFDEKDGVTFEALAAEGELLINTEVISSVKSTEDAAMFHESGMKEICNENRKKLKRSPSPPFVAMPKKPKTTPAAATAQRGRSLSSVSNISNSDLSDFDSSQKEPPKNTVIWQEKKHNKYYHQAAPYTKNNDNFNKFQRRARRTRSRLGSPLVHHQGVRKKFYRNLMPWQKSNYVRSRSDSVSANSNKEENDKYDEYKRLSMAIINDMEKTLKKHEKNPEKHPQYSEEWKKFWNKRYKELAVEGKDVSSYDFKPEWIKFWNKRMLEIHEIEVKAKKDALHKRLGFPEKPAPSCFKITGKRLPGERDSSKPVPMASVPDKDPGIIVIDDKDEESVESKQRSQSPWETEFKTVAPVSHERSQSKMNMNESPPRGHGDHDKSRERSCERSVRERNNRSIERSWYSKDRSHSRDKSAKRLHKKRIYGIRSRSRSRDRSRYPNVREFEEGKYSKAYPHEIVYYRESQYIKPSRILRDVTRRPVHSPSELPHSPPVEMNVLIDDNEEVNIVGILRLITALEDKLGSLGPKVIDLLSQALALEKNLANSSESLLDNEANCVLFETVKEKLKGLLLAGLMNYNQEKACKHAIKSIASLLHYAGQRSKEKDKIEDNPIKVPGVGTVDKGAIAKMIATALVNQGKTDVTQEQLEELINAVVGMTEASRNSGKPVTSASFLQQLTQATVSENKSKPPTESLVTALQERNPEPNSKMQHLSDCDLQMLLQNFKDLCTEEQHNLISYLKRLESKEPERVEHLRKFVNLDESANASGENLLGDSSPKKITESEASGHTSPFSSRFAGHNPTVEEHFDDDDNESIVSFDNENDTNKSEEREKRDEPVKIMLESEDEDYSYEDVFKAAKQNVTEKEENDKKTARASSIVFKTEDFDLSNAKSLIANIMGQLKESNSPIGKHSPSTSVGAQKPEKASLQMITQNIDNYPINLANLANAVKTAQLAKPNPTNFPPNSNASLHENTNQNATGIPLNLNTPTARPMINQIQSHVTGPSTNLNQHQNHYPMTDMLSNFNPYSMNNHKIQQNMPLNHSVPPNLNIPFNRQISSNHNIPSFGKNYTPNVGFHQQNQFVCHPNRQFRVNDFNNQPDCYENNPIENRLRPGTYDNNYGPPRW